jgi:hypothetical protein
MKVCTRTPPLPYASVTNNAESFRPKKGKLQEFHQLAATFKPESAAPKAA